MRLILETVGLLSITALLASILRQQSCKSDLRTAIIVLSVGSISVFFWARILPLTKQLNHEYKKGRRLSVADANLGSGKGAANTDFLQWVKKQIKPAETYYPQPPVIVQDPFLFQWITYQLVPLKLAKNTVATNWWVIYSDAATIKSLENPPNQRPQNQRKISKLMKYSNDFALAKVRHAN